MTKDKSTKNPFNLIVIVAALGYFVDIYDLVLFSVERIDSLKEILGASASKEEIKKTN